MLMANTTKALILFLLFLNSCYLTLSSTSFPLTVARRYTSEDTPPSAYRSSLNYTVALIASIFVGTPPQQMDMVMDTGSHVTWITCLDGSESQPKLPMFNPDQSTSFNKFLCNRSSNCVVTDPGIMNCVRTRPFSIHKGIKRCHFTIEYADKFKAVGDLVKENVALSDSQSPSSSSLALQDIILGCTSANDPTGSQGLMGMNLGNLSFATQANIKKFSYCVPKHGYANALYNPYNNLVTTSTGKLYLGSNPYSPGFKYVDLWNSDGIPSIDSLAYTVLLKYVYIGEERLDFSGDMGPGTSDGCPMMIDSGTQYSSLLPSTLTKLREKVDNLTTGFNLTKTDSGSFDICFNNDTDPSLVSSRIGDLVFELNNQVNITIPAARILDYIENKLCVTIGQPADPTAATNTLGISHQQCLWVEYDIQRKRVGFGNVQMCEESCG